jgi:hypothetical protein
MKRYEPKADFCLGEGAQDHDKEVELFVVAPAAEVTYDGVVRLGASSPATCITNTPSK